MAIVERIVRQRRSMPESAQTAVLDFIRCLKSKASRMDEKYELAMRG